MTLAYQLSPARGQPLAVGRTFTDAELGREIDLS